MVLRLLLQDLLPDSLSLHPRHMMPVLYKGKPEDHSS